MNKSADFPNHFLSKFKYLKINIREKKSFIMYFFRARCTLLPLPRGAQFLLLPPVPLPPPEPLPLLAYHRTQQWYLKRPNTQITTASS